MDIYPEDFWMTYKNSWAPQPGWLSPDAASLAPRERAVREAASAADLKNDAAQSSDAGEDRPVFTERRKKKPVARRPFRGRRVPVQDHELLFHAGRQRDKMNLENVVVLRPRFRDYTYADYVLSALRSMFEAQAAGQKELLLARIKLVSHLLEDIGRRRQG
jgi:hypothetical protein